VAVAWAFKDEAEGYADTVLDYISDSGAVVPDIWVYETVNALLVGERRRRIMPADSDRFIRLLRDLPVEVEEMTFAGLSDLALLTREYELTAYDAAYLAVAVRRGIPLATQDRALQKAARRSGAEVFDS
jgi:predicted nucleic acid-binding protein